MDANVMSSEVETSLDFNCHLMPRDYNLGLHHNLERFLDYAFGSARNDRHSFYSCLFVFIRG